MGRGSLGKRIADQPASHVSVTTHILPKRPRTESTPPVKPLQTSWQAFNAHIESTLHSLYEPALDSISTALATSAKSGKLPAVCLNLPSCDRPSTFSAILKHLRKPTRTILHLRSTQHGSINTITPLLDAEPEDKYLVIALEDADRFAEETLRDVIYVCSKRREEQRVALVLGLGASVEAFHNALGIYEAGMICSTVVDMPDGKSCFKAIVKNVLNSSKLDIELSYEVYDLLERNFFARQGSVASFVRSVHHAFSLHFCKVRLAGVFVQEGCVEVLKRAGEKYDAGMMVCKEMNLRVGECVKMLRHEVGSTREYVERCEGGVSDEELCRLACEWHESLEMRRRRRRVMQVVTYKLLEVVKVWDVRRGQGGSGGDSDIELEIFRAFLPGSDGGIGPAGQQLVNVVCSRIGKAGRGLLQKIVSCMKESLTRGEEAEGSDELLHTLQQRLDQAWAKAEERGTEGEKRVDTLGPGAGRKRIARGGTAALVRRKACLLSAQTGAGDGEGLKQGREMVKQVVQELARGCCMRGAGLREMRVFGDREALAQARGLGGVAEPRGSFFTAMRRVGAGGEVGDTGVAYRLLSQGGRLHNLYDWYNAFAAVRAAGCVRRDGEGKICGMGEVSQAEVQVRFGRACSELEFLGLFKYTNRKTDHALRLVFE